MAGIFTILWPLHATVVFIQQDAPLLLLIISSLLSTENQELAENTSHALTGTPSEYAFLYDKIFFPLNV